VALFRIFLFARIAVQQAFLLALIFSIGRLRCPPSNMPIESSQCQ